MPTSRSHEIDQITKSKVLAVTVIIGLLVILQYLTNIITLENTATHESYRSIMHFLIIFSVLTGGIIFVISINNLFRVSDDNIVNSLGALGSLIYIHTSIAYTPTCYHALKPVEFPYLIFGFGHKHYIPLFDHLLIIDLSLLPILEFIAPSGSCYITINIIFPLLSYFFITLWLWSNNILQVNVLDLDAE